MNTKYNLFNGILLLFSSTLYASNNPFTNVKPIQVVHNSNQINFFILALSGLGVVLLLVSFLKNKNKLNQLRYEEIKKNYKDANFPVILICENELISWSNIKAINDLDLTLSSSFFIDKEIKEDSKKQKIFYEHNSKKYDLIFEPIKVKESSLKLIFFIPESDKQEKISINNTQSAQI